MKNFKIKLRTNTFYINEGKSVIGDICYSVDGWDFPEEDWDDFVVIILLWLAQALIKLQFNKKEVEVEFMEGCFKISLFLKENDRSDVTIKFIEGDSFADQEEIILKTITTPFEELKNEVKNACETLIQMKESKEIDFEKDYEDLKNAYNLLCKL